MSWFSVVLWQFQDGASLERPRFSWVMLAWSTSAEESLVRPIHGRCCDQPGFHWRIWPVGVLDCGCLERIHGCNMGMDQYLLIPFLGEWTSIYQLFWCELQGYKVLTHCHMLPWKVQVSIGTSSFYWVAIFMFPRNPPGFGTTIRCLDHFPGKKPAFWGLPWLLALGAAEKKGLQLRFTVLFARVKPQRLNLVRQDQIFGSPHEPSGDKLSFVAGTKTISILSAAVGFLNPSLSISSLFVLAIHVHLPHLGDPKCLYCKPCRCTGTSGSCLSPEAAKWLVSAAKSRPSSRMVMKACNPRKILKSGYVVEDELNIDTELETSGDIDVWNAKKCRRCLHLEPSCRAGRQEADAEEATPSRGSTTTALEIWQPKWPMLQSDVAVVVQWGDLLPNHKSRLFQVHLLTCTLSLHFISFYCRHCWLLPINTNNRYRVTVGL